MCQCVDESLYVYNIHVLLMYILGGRSAGFHVRYCTSYSPQSDDGCTSMDTIRAGDKKTGYEIRIKCYTGSLTLSRQA